MPVVEIIEGSGEATQKHLLGVPIVVRVQVIAEPELSNPFKKVFLWSNCPVGRVGASDEPNWHATECFLSNSDPDIFVGILFPACPGTVDVTAKALLCDGCEVWAGEYGQNLKFNVRENHIAKLPCSSAEEMVQFHSLFDRIVSTFSCTAFDSCSHGMFYSKCYFATLMAWWCLDTHSKSAHLPDYAACSWQKDVFGLVYLLMSFVTDANSVYFWFKQMARSVVAAFALADPPRSAFSTIRAGTLVAVPLVEQCSSAARKTRSECMSPALGDSGTTRIADGALSFLLHLALHSPISGPDSEALLMLLKGLVLQNQDREVSSGFAFTLIQCIYSLPQRSNCQFNHSLPPAGLEFLQSMAKSLFKLSSASRSFQSVVPLKLSRYNGSTPPPRLASNSRRVSLAMSICSAIEECLMNHVKLHQVRRSQVGTMHGSAMRSVLEAVEEPQEAAGGNLANLFGLIDSLMTSSLKQARGETKMTTSNVQPGILSFELCAEGAQKSANDHLWVLMLRAVSYVLCKLSPGEEKVLEEGFRIALKLCALVPLSAVLTLIHRLLKNVPWFGDTSKEQVLFKYLRVLFEKVTEQADPPSVKASLLRSGLLDAYFRRICGALKSRHFALTRMAIEVCKSREERFGTYLVFATTQGLARSVLLELQALGDSDSLPCSVQRAAKDTHHRLQVASRLGKQPFSSSPSWARPETEGKSAFGPFPVKPIVHKPSVSFPTRVRCEPAVEDSPELLRSPLHARLLRSAKTLAAPLVTGGKGDTSWRAALALMK